MCHRYIKGAVMVPHPPLIIPEIGRGQEKEIAQTISSYRKAASKISQMKPDTIVILSPHTTMYADYFHISPGSRAHGDFSQFRIPQVSFEAEYDKELVREISALCQGRNFPAGTLGQKEPALDHGVMVPLYFIGKEIPDCRLVRVGLSGLPLTEHYTLGTIIKEAVEKLRKRTVLVASGDLSHCLKPDGPYGYREEGPVYDQQIMDVMGCGDFGRLFEFTDEFRSQAGECGHGAFAIMAGALDKTAVKAERISYQGTFGVGYGVCLYETLGQDENRAFLEIYKRKEQQRLAEKKAAEDPYVRLARASTEHYVKHGVAADMPENLPAEMLRGRAGAFVSLKKNGRLRGCIGTINPVQANMAEEIMANAVSAAVRDPRFDPVQPAELDELEYSVDILGKTEAISSQSQLDIKRYGVIVTNGTRRGLLLPNLEGVHSVEQQIAIAKEKAGIQQQEQVELERFEVVRHK